MLDDIYVKSTKAFSVAITVDGVAPVLSGIDVVRLIIKKSMTDPDEDAIILKTGVNKEGGIVDFELTPQDTDVPPRKLCYYELEWKSGDKVEPLEIGTLSILDKVFD